MIVAACSAAPQPVDEAAAIAAEVTTVAADAASDTGPTSTSPGTTTSTPSTVAATTTTTTTRPPPTTVAALDRSAEATAQRMFADLAIHGLHLPRPGGSSAEKITAELLGATVSAITREPVTFQTVPLPNAETTANVWAEPIGDGPVSILLGAHYDTVTVSPGVDDNGSGSVVLLELIRRLSEAPLPGVVVHVVFFGAEEVLAGHDADDHHFGSRFAADRLAGLGELPDWMISVDMIGVGERLMAVAYEASDPAMVAALVDAGTSVGVEVVALERGDISDHEAFARHGVPAAMLWRPDNPAWHTAEDEALNTDLLIEDLAVLESLLAMLGS